VNVNRLLSIGLLFFAGCTQNHEGQRAVDLTAQLEKLEEMRPLLAAEDSHFNPIAGPPLEEESISRATKLLGDDLVQIDQATDGYKNFDYEIDLLSFEEISSRPDDLDWMLDDLPFHVPEPNRDALMVFGQAWATGGL